MQYISMVKSRGKDGLFGIFEILYFELVVTLYGSKIARFKSDLWFIHRDGYQNVRIFYRFQNTGNFQLIFQVGDMGPQ